MNKVILADKQVPDGIARRRRRTVGGRDVHRPRGVEHRPVAEEECAVMLFEPASTLNTGNVRTARTIDHLDRL